MTQRAPQLGATFYPGGEDEYYMYVTRKIEPYSCQRT